MARQTHAGPSTRQPAVVDPRGQAGADSPSLLGADDLHLFNEGTHYRLYDKLGAHLVRSGGESGVQFGVWAPNARYVAVVGDFNGWDRGRNPLKPRGSAGLWEGFVPGVAAGARYKFHVASRENSYTADKADPFGAMHETPPNTASIVHGLEYAWGDAAWMRDRGSRQTLRSPMSIYEVHIGSWMRSDEGDGTRPLSYRELAPRLADYVKSLGFTHVEFMPVMEHPFYGSWGYQTTGYFAPTSRYGTPQDFMFLVDHLHQNGIGVILDWVPSHFPSDEHGLGYFDGTHLFEHSDPRQGFHPDWKSLIFNYSRHETRAFLISSAVFWLDKYHADGLRVDAVASMLYLDYGRRTGEWIPNRFGGRENIDAVEFLRQLNSEVYRSFPDVQTIAEESTAWPMVSKPVYVGGLGFGMKWDMGWMHDTLGYLQQDPVYRKFAHNSLTFRSMYQFAENYVLPLSHDEVVHLKGSLLSRMPGDVWQKFANLRLLLALQWLEPGKKLLFMGGEFGQWGEWNHDSGLDWALASPGSPHDRVRALVTQLNRLHRELPALHEFDSQPQGFEWIDANDADQSVISFLRRGAGTDELAVAVINCTPVVRRNYRIGVDRAGIWREVLNTDAMEFGGSGQGNMGQVEAAPVPCLRRPFSLNLTLPPLAALLLTPERGATAGSDPTKSQPTP
ncbi:MAG: 1,4-alpha-glucan branching protein GlgB [Phycisphaeraceae bacterium]|nr:1,4-alpha-glucan branching protein GlgB [Phycisphaeraceae bacterium]